VASLRQKELQSIEELEYVHIEYVRGH